MRHKHHGRNWRAQAPLRSRLVADRGGDRPLQPQRGEDRPLPLPRRQDPTPWEQPEFEQLMFDLEHLEALITR